jgi:hypothetical protein
LTKRHQPGGWVAFRNTFGKPIGNSPRIQSWIGRAACHALASRVLGDLCFRLAANGVRDETMGMVAKVYATKALLQTAIHVYQIQGGRSVHTDERRRKVRAEGEAALSEAGPLIENYIGENMHEFTIATVYEGPNAVLADVGAPNAMTRGIRAKYLEPIGLAEVNGKLGWLETANFGWFIVRTTLGSWNPWVGSGSGIEQLHPEKKRIVQRALKRNRVLGRRILMIVARYQKSFIDQSFLLGDEGGIFDQLCSTLAALVFTLSLEEPQAEYLQVARALDLESSLRMKGRSDSPELQRAWAEIGSLVMQPNSTLYTDLIGQLEVSDIPLDPRFIDRFI